MTQTKTQTSLNRQTNQKVIQNRWERSPALGKIIRWRDRGPSQDWNQKEETHMHRDHNKKQKSQVLESSPGSWGAITGWSVCQIALFMLCLLLSFDYVTCMWLLVNTWDIIPLLFLFVQMWKKWSLELHMYHVSKKQPENWIIHVDWLFPHYYTHCPLSYYHIPVISYNACKRGESLSSFAAVNKASTTFNISPKGHAIR